MPFYRQSDGSFATYTDPALYISPEDAAFLKELSKKMNSQDNRLTQHPLFAVQDKKRTYWVEDYDGHERKVDDLDEDDLCESCRKLYDEGGGGLLPENCDDCDSNAFIPFREEEYFDLASGVFITAEACENHIESNRHHYREPNSFGVGSYRNPEMQRLLKILSSIDTGEPASFYR